MKQFTIILLAILLLLSAGCMSQVKKQNPADGPVQENSAVEMKDSVEIKQPASVSLEPSAEVASMIYSSVDEMTAAIHTERQAKDKDVMARINDLERLSVVYAPANEFEGFQIHHIAVNPYSVFYYYTPEGDTLPGFSYSTGILVTNYRNTKFDTRTFFANNRLHPDEDGFAYDEEMREMTFIQDDAVISIRVPEHMNDYDTIRSLCEMEKIEIPWTKEEGGGKNEVAMPRFSSVDELISGVLAERQSELKSALAQSGELESLSFLYVPSNIIAGYFMHEIKVTPECVILNMPHEEEVEPYLEWECVIFTQYRSEDVTLHSICDQYGLTLNEDSWAYDDDNRRVFYELDGTVIGLQVPEYMNDYDTIHGLCGMEKIEITEDNIGITKEEPGAARGEIEAEEKMPTFSSVEAMVQSGSFESLSEIYTPPGEIEGFCLWKIEPSSRDIKYYYSPVGEMWDHFKWSQGILYTVSRDSKMTLDSVCAQLGIEPDEDGYAYDARMSKMHFAQDGTVISVRVPEDMNDYDTLRSLCGMEKIKIP